MFPGDARIYLSKLLLITVSQ